MYATFAMSTTELTQNYTVLIGTISSHDILYYL